MDIEHSHSFGSVFTSSATDRIARCLLVVVVINSIYSVAPPRAHEAGTAQPIVSLLPGGHDRATRSTSR